MRRFFKKSFKIFQCSEDGDDVKSMNINYNLEQKKLFIFGVYVSCLLASTKNVIKYVFTQTTAGTIHAKNIFKSEMNKKQIYNI